MSRCSCVRSSSAYRAMRSHSLVRHITTPECARERYSTFCATPRCDNIPMVNDGLEPFARDFSAGTVLFEEGQPGDYMYVVQSGEVEIRRLVGETERVLAV